MNLIYTQRRLTGGIQPPEHKQLSASQPVRRAALPNRIFLPLIDERQQPLTPLVAPGDSVTTGQLVASCPAGLGANLHSSISGQVVAIEQRPLLHPSGLPVASLIIQSDGQDKPAIHLAGWHPRLRNWHTANKEELLNLIAQAGITGLGGAGFLAAAKIRAASQQPVRSLIINAAECEPFITTDAALIQTQASAILEGCALLSYLVQAQEVLIGIEDNKPLAIQALSRALAAATAVNANHPGASELAKLKICVVPTRYPSGSDKLLIQLLTGQEVPSGQLASDLGILCHNVASCYAIYQAITQGQPLIERLVTLTGSQLNQPGNYWVRVGTPLNQLLQEAAANPNADLRLIIGGPLMGYQLAVAPGLKFTRHFPGYSAYASSKSLNCLLVPTPTELPTPAPEQACIRCGKCELVCPLNLLPQQLYFYAAGQAWQQAEQQQLFDCIECGACTWVCPSSIPLVDYYRQAKAELRQAAAAQQLAATAQRRYEARTARLQQEEQERAARRQARLDALAQVNPAPQPPASAANNLSNSPSLSLQTSSNAQAGPSPQQLKQLHMAKAAAQTAVSKAEKSLHNLNHNPDTTAEQLEQQQQRLELAKEQLAKVLARLAASTGQT